MSQVLNHATNQLIEIWTNGQNDFYSIGKIFYFMIRVISVMLMIKIRDFGYWFFNDGFFSVENITKLINHIPAII